MELTLIVFLNLMSDKFCELKSQDMDTVKAVAVSLSHVQDKYGGRATRCVIIDTPLIGSLAVASAATKCPQHL